MPAARRPYTAFAPPRHRGPFYVPGKGERPHLYPHVCLKCRSSFRRPVGLDAYARPCPRCSHAAMPLWTKFKPPARDDLRQWAKVEALVRHGFFFLEAGEPYPDQPAHVEAFARRQAARVDGWRGRFPDYYVELAAAL